MVNTHLFLLLTAVLCWYCMGVSWLLQYVVYPTYKHIAVENFSKYHSDLEQRLLKVAVIPKIVTNILMMTLIFMHPETCPMGLIYLTALCSMMILYSTFRQINPKNRDLRENGLSNERVEYLIQKNLPRSLVWTVASCALCYMVFKTMV